MNVALLRTEGYGRAAEIEVDGSRLTVVDGISRAEAPASPGPIENPKFDVVFVVPGSWRRAIEANPDGERKLEPQWGWRYLGFGRVVALDPVRLDFGALVLELSLPPAEDRKVGDSVCLAIDRIRLARAPR